MRYMGVATRLQVYPCGCGQQLLWGCQRYDISRKHSCQRQSDTSSSTSVTTQDWGTKFGLSRCLHTDSSTKRSQPAPSLDAIHLKEFSEIPGPKEWPVFGNLVQIMMRKDYDPAQIHKMWRNLFKEYGPIVKISTPTKRPFIATTNPDDLEIIYKTTADNPIRRSLGVLKKIRDNAPNNFYQKKTGLLPENGEEWWRLRSRVQGPLLRPRNVASYLPMVDRATLTYMDRIDMLQEKTGQVPPDEFLEDTYRWALECVAYVALDLELGCLKPDLSDDSTPMKIIKNINEVFDFIGGTSMSFSTWRYIKTPAFVKLEKAHNAFLEIADQAIQEATRKLDEAKAKGDPNRTLTVMETFLNTEGLSRGDVTTVILDMLFGGVDTTSHTLAFVLYVLATNPDGQKKLQQEVDTVMGDAKELLPDHIAGMTYLANVVKEAMRLYPLGLGLSRVLTQDVVMSGYKVPEGSVAMAFNMMICRDEKYFPRPNDFLPERWSRDRPYGPIHPYASLPFSHGKRMCIGKRIAEQEIYTFLIRAMQKYSITFESTQEMELKTQLAMKPMIPLAFKFHHRN